MLEASTKSGSASTEGGTTREWARRIQDPRYRQRMLGPSPGILDTGYAAWASVFDVAPSAAFSASKGVGGSVGTSARRPRGRLAPAARTQFRKVSGLIPRSAATCRIVAWGRDWYSATASALNCGG